MATSKILRIVALCFLVIVGTLIGVASARLVAVKPGYTSFLEKLGRREHITWASGSIDPSWLIEGSPVFQSKKFEHAHDGSSHSGIWRCLGPAKFHWYYEVDESIYILDGSAEIEYLGNKFTLSAGDSTHFAAGTSATWIVPTQV